MKIYITDKNEIRNVQLKSWSSNNWSPDMFADIADTIPADFPISEEQRDGSDAVAAMTEEEYKELVAWWEDEISKYNNRNEKSWFFQNSDPETATDELELFTD